MSDLPAARQGRKARTEPTASVASRLSLRLLALIVSTILVIDVLVYLPSVAKFRRDFLSQRMAAAQIAALSLTEMPGHAVSEALKETLLGTAGVDGVVLDLGERRALILRDADADAPIDARYSIQTATPVQLIVHALETLLRGGQGRIEVQGAPLDIDGMSLSVVMDETELHAAMLVYTRNIAMISLLIAGLTGLVVYWVLFRSIVRPIRGIMAAMVAFRNRPDDPTTSLAPSDRRDEIGMAERELARMQADLRQALGQRRRLAMLGQAVGKVNHDLRNILATAQLSSERLQQVDDPGAQKASTRMVRAIDRAIGLCERTLAYGRADEPLPSKADTPVHAVAAEVIAATEPSPGVTWDNQIPEDLTAYADPDHLYRMLLNLTRNAAQALTAKAEARQAAGHAPKPGRVTLTGHRDGEGGVVVRITDNGPGLPREARENLFVPFAGTQAKGGSGLGLTIVHELMLIHGGQVTLERSDAQGTTFRLRFPPG
ncbi:signal transduction histidine kinase /histidine kinase [Rhodothalassium salexigens DSM 2132]|uniref:histidine kinase n=1 Tax=Rhodothalassium salexigens DSM 2132 TaxID=1188247 RepID=A0A4R2PNA2_RHOSA|nr:HAMP domain-containing sensor histidine kinase [Rhodothalassium salexigens]MBB4210938.1 signal transduction histidine kinase [Rhodothalassium salexigens DSM 2132]TCP36404.1 signal transduction histidine kinase /histidine kinase [Rhodothalassium salexigens DSM 2132]